MYPFLVLQMLVFFWPCCQLYIKKTIAEKKIGKKGRVLKEIPLRDRTEARVSRCEQRCTENLSADFSIT